MPSLVFLLFNFWRLGQGYMEVPGRITIYLKQELPFGMSAVASKMLYRSGEGD